MERAAILKYLFTTAAVSIAVVAVVVRYRSETQHKDRMFSVEELSLYNGTDEGLPILLAVIGSVFDVTKGRSHYGVGGGYHHFAGRDASRAFVSGNFTGGLELLGGIYLRCVSKRILNSQYKCPIGDKFKTPKS